MNWLAFAMMLGVIIYQCIAHYIEQRANRQDRKALIDRLIARDAESLAYLENAQQLETKELDVVDAETAYLKAIGEGNDMGGFSVQ